MDHSELRARRDIIVETKALLVLSRFPGTDMSLDDDGTYLISHNIDHSFDTGHIPIAELLPTAKSVIIELENRYGPGGTLLEKTSLYSFMINPRPAV